MGRLHLRPGGSFMSHCYYVPHEIFFDFSSALSYHAPRTSHDHATSIITNLLLLITSHHTEVLCVREGLSYQRPTKDVTAMIRR